MSGFDKDWLTLREPADMAARSRDLLDTVYHHLGTRSAPIIMDIGCGTGSTYRTLSPSTGSARWRLVDYEAGLLQEASHKIGPSDSVEFHQQDLNHLDETLLDGVNVVTASALFDLCSAEFCDLFLARLDARKIGLYAALNYDGVMRWSRAHPLDEKVVEDFNAHQGTDKGFGPALGPKASDYLMQAGKTLGWTCESAQSPWQLGPESAELQKAFLEGLRQPVIEIGRTTPDEFETWLEFRLSTIRESGNHCVVGHTDVFLRPAT